MVCELRPIPLESARKLRNSVSKNLVACEVCDFKTSYVDMRMHMKVRHRTKKVRESINVVTKTIGAKSNVIQDLIGSAMSKNNERLLSEDYGGLVVDYHDCWES